MPVWGDVAAESHQSCPLLRLWSWGLILSTPRGWRRAWRQPRGENHPGTRVGSARPWSPHFVAWSLPARVTLSKPFHLSDPPPLPLLRTTPSQSPGPTLGIGGSCRPTPVKGHAPKAAVQWESWGPAAPSKRAAPQTRRSPGLGRHSQGPRPLPKPRARSRALAHPSAGRSAESHSPASVCFLANYCLAAALLLIQ